MPRHFFITAMVIAALWFSWMAYWAVCALSVKRSVYVQPLHQKLLFRVLLVAAIVCMQDIPVLHHRFVPPYVALDIAGIALCAGGLAFAVWARVHLAGNWSSWVALKEGHELVTTGPYALVRHPIYTGVLTALVGTMLALAPSIGGCISMVLMVIAFLMRVFAEEAIMNKQFPDAYPAYKARVRAALIPFLV